jgi:hypothetical protein
MLIALAVEGGCKDATEPVTDTVCSAPFASMLAPVNDTAGKNESTFDADCGRPSVRPRMSIDPPVDTTRAGVSELDWVIATPGAALPLP